MKRNIKDFTSYAKEKYYNMIIDYIKKYIIEYDNGYIVDKIEIKKLLITDLTKDDIKIYWYVDIYVTSKQFKKLKNIKRRIIESIYSLCDVKEQLKILNLIYYIETINDIILTKDLIPIIISQNYDEICEKILRKYYCKALISPTKINTIEFVKKIGLNILFLPIYKKKNQLGLMFFKKGEVTLYENNKYYNKIIEENTIVIDSKINKFDIDLIIMHECIHYLFHKKAFLFLQETPKDISKDIKYEINSNMFFMEYQADMMSVNLLLPKNTFLQKVKETFNYYNVKDLNSYLDNIEKVILSLSKFYDLDIYTIIKRLSDIGYVETMGTFNYINNKYVSSYIYPKEQYSKKIVYTISIQDLMKTLNEDNILKEYLKNKEYLYVDGHLVLNEPKYIKQDNDDNFELTIYAKEHIDECSISFIRQIDIDDEIQDYYISAYFAKEINTPYEYKMVYHNGYENNTDNNAKSEYFKQELKKEQEFYLQLTNSFTESLKKLKKWRNVSNKWIAEKTMINISTIERTFRGDTKPTIENLIIILIALKTPYLIFEHIINLSPNKIDLQNDNHWVLINFVIASYGMKMEEVRENAKLLKINL